MAASVKKLPGAERLLAISAAVLALAAAATGLVLADTAHAQTLDANSASFNAGYGRVAGSENHVVEYSTRDANGNRVIVDGVMLTGADQSVYSSSHSSGSLDSYSGVGLAGGLRQLHGDRQQPDGRHPGQQQHGDRQLQPDQQRQHQRRNERREIGKWPVSASTFCWRAPAPCSAPAAAFPSR